MNNAVTAILDFIQFGVIASAGAMAKYMSDIQKGKKSFSWFGTLTIIVLAFFLGNTIVSFLGTDHEYLGGILMVAGYSLDQCLKLLETLTEDYLKRLKK